MVVELRKWKEKKKKNIGEQNKDEIELRNKRYVENNREKLLQKKREFNEMHRDHKNQCMMERYQGKKKK